MKGPRPSSPDDQIDATVGSVTKEEEAVPVPDETAPVPTCTETTTAESDDVIEIVVAKEVDESPTPIVDNYRSHCRSTPARIGELRLAIEGPREGPSSTHLACGPERWPGIWPHPPK